MWFSLGGIPVSPQAGLEFVQRYEPEDSVALTRLAGGGLLQDVAWRKLATTIEGSGRYPPGLDGLDYDQPLVMRCAQPRELTAAGNVFALPAARRSDAGFGPVGYALVTAAGDDPILDPRWQDTAVDLVGDTATLAVVAGASLYQVWYWPELTVFAQRPQIDTQAQPAGVGSPIRWTLTAREI